MKKIKVAITGGIGSGKSLVSSYFENKGYPVIRADDVAKELMLNDESVKKKIIKIFGEQSYNGNKLNTKFLSEKIFINSENVAKINSIVHPSTIKKIEEVIQRHFQSTEIVFIESALVFEAKIQKNFDFIILVYSKKNIRMNRTMARDKSGEEEIGKRISFQIPDEKKKERVHFVIENNSTIEELKIRAEFILQLLKNLSS